MEVNPVTNDLARMLRRLEPMAMHTLLLLYDPDDSIDHAVLL